MLRFNLRPRLNIRVFLLSFIATTTLVAQNYTDKIDDKFIERIIKKDIKKYWHPLLDKKPRFIYYQPSEWDSYYFKLAESDDEWFLKDQYIVDKLKNLLNENEVEELITSYNDLKNKNIEWNFDSKRIKKTKGVTSETPRIFYYTIPLFTKNKKFMLMSRYFYCGSLCAELKVMLFKKGTFGKWKLIEKLVTMES